MFWVRFWVSPLSSVNQLLLQNKIGLLANLVLLAVSVLVVVFSDLYRLDIEGMLHLFNVVLVGFYLVFFSFLYCRAMSVRRCAAVESGSGVE